MVSEASGEAAAMAMFQWAPPEKFTFRTPQEWPKWIRRFERFRQASGLAGKGEESQVNALIYSMGTEADDILHSFHLSQEDAKKYNTVKEKFEAYFVMLSMRELDLPKGHNNPTSQSTVLSLTYTV